MLFRWRRVLLPCSAFFSAYISFTALLKYGTALTESIDVTAFPANNSCRHLIPSVTGADTADPEPRPLQLGASHHGATGG